MICCRGDRWLEITGVTGIRVRFGGEFLVGGLGQVSDSSINDGVSGATCARAVAPAMTLDANRPVSSLLFGIARNPESNVISSPLTIIAISQPELAESTHTPACTSYGVVVTLFVA